jgi:hypothetical protein
LTTLMPAQAGCVVCHSFAACRSEGLPQPAALQCWCTAEKHCSAGALLRSKLEACEGASAEGASGGWSSAGGTAGRCWASVAASFLLFLHNHMGCQPLPALPCGHARTACSITDGVRRSAASAALCVLLIQGRTHQGTVLPLQAAACHAAPCAIQQGAEPCIHGRMMVCVDPCCMSVCMEFV